jgi:hypothetical protein
MLTSRAVIQRIDACARRVHLHQNFELRSSWTFETRLATPSSSHNEAIFPFIFHGSEHFSEGNPGAETKLRFTSDGRLLFADDYGVPGEFVIGVLFPRGYAPQVFKFKVKPFIPTGVGLAGASMSPPGHFEVFFNAAARFSAVVFIVSQPTYFGFKCIAAEQKDGFPRGGENPFVSDLYATLCTGETHPIKITAKDLEAFKGQFSASANLEEVAQAVNRLSELSRGGDYGRVTEAHRWVKRFQDALSTTASAVQLSDSYLSGGTIGILVAKLIAYCSL